MVFDETPRKPNPYLKSFSYVASFGRGPRVNDVFLSNPVLLPLYSAELAGAWYL